MRRREETGIGVRGERGGLGFPLDHRHLMAVAIELVSRCYSRNSRTQNCNFHVILRRPADPATSLSNMPSTTHRDAFHFDHPVESYWEASADPLNLDLAPLMGDARCDVAIIGAGYTGLSTALALREDYGLDVRVLDAAMPGWGASGRNGGFACIGSHKLGYGTMIQRYGRDETVRFFNTMRDAVDLVRDNCRRYGIDASLTEGGEVSLAHRPNRVAELAEEKDFHAGDLRRADGTSRRKRLARTGSVEPAFPRRPCEARSAPAFTRSITCADWPARRKRRVRIFTRFRASEAGQITRKSTF